MHNCSNEFNFKWLNLFVKNKIPNEICLKLNYFLLGKFQNRQCQGFQWRRRLVFCSCPRIYWFAERSIWTFARKSLLRSLQLQIQPLGTFFFLLRVRLFVLLLRFYEIFTCSLFWALVTKSRPTFSFGLSNDLVKSRTFNPNKWQTFCATEN